MSRRPKIASRKIVAPLHPKLKLTEKPCDRCLLLAKAGEIDIETVQRLPEGAWAPLARDRSGKCCYDCAAADAVMSAIGGMTFKMARIAVGNDRREQYRLPGVPMGLVLEGYVRPSAPGDLDDQLRWLEHNKWFGLVSPDP